MGASRPKLEIPRNKIINIRVTQFEFEKISRIAKQKILIVLNNFSNNFFLRSENFCKLVRIYRQEVKC